jgi:hypothetical protein
VLNFCAVGVQEDHEIQRRQVPVQPQETRHEVMVAQSVSRQRAIQILGPVHAPQAT